MRDMVSMPSSKLKKFQADYKQLKAENKGLKEKLEIYKYTSEDIDTAYENGRDDEAAMRETPKARQALKDRD